MNGPATVAEHLGDRTEAVIEIWRLAVRESGDVPRARSLTRTEFVDHVPVLIDRMVDRLLGRSVDLSVTAEIHGQMRWNQGYDIVEILSEFAHLRATLTQATFACARENGLGLDALENAQGVIHEVLDEVINQSVRQFQEENESRHGRSMAELEDRRRSVEEERRNAEVERARLDTLLASLPVGVWVADAEGRIVTLNAVAETLQQTPAESTVGLVNTADRTPIFQFFRTDGTGYAPRDIPIARALEGGVVDQEEMLWSQPEGVRVVAASASPLRDAHGAITGAVMVVQDVTGRKRLESDLLATSAQLTGIIEKSPVMIWKTGPDGRVDFVNRTFLDFLALRADEGLDEGWVARVHPEDTAGVVESFARSMAARENFARDYRIRDASGNYRWIASRGVPICDDHGLFLGYLGSWLDITDRHELEAALQQQKQIAEASSQHKTRLMSALSHDARTPLNAVVLSAQLLEMHVQDGDNPEVEECLRTIRNGVKNVLDLLGDLLDLTRIDAGAMPLENAPFSLEEAILECISSIQTPARLKGLDFRVDLDGLNRLTIKADRAKIKQILSNFLSNALRYTERGQIALRASFDVHEIRIGVTDTGVGIGDADQARVFDEFATLENPRRATGEGTGLGLAICRRLAGLLGGKIELVSRKGQGSTFTLVLPASLIVATAAEEAPTHQAPNGPGEGAIVVAEDHRDSRRTLSRLLRMMGYRVLEAEDGRAAVDHARAERPLAILMDVNMPGMNGIDATLAIRSEPALADVPIFALTGDVTAENQRRIEDAGVQGYLEKPVTADALKFALASLSRP